MFEYKKNKIEFKKSLNFPCSYLNGLIERRLYVNFDNLSKKNNQVLLTELTKNGFRRSYNHLYIPICENCNSCISSRINIKDFKLSKSNKRVLKINEDLIFRNKTKQINDQHFKLFKKYCLERHQSSQMKNMNEREFKNFFYDSKNKTKIFDLTNKSKKLFGSILVDVLNDGYSAVYSFFDPSEKKRGLGKLLILKLIEELKFDNHLYLYLGYWVKGSKTMHYKSNFNNVEFFYNGNWAKKPHK